MNAGTQPLGAREFSHAAAKSSRTKPYLVETYSSTAATIRIHTFASLGVVQSEGEGSYGTNDHTSRDCGRLRLDSDRTDSGDIGACDHRRMPAFYNGYLYSCRPPHIVTLFAPNGQIVLTVPIQGRGQRQRKRTVGRD